jgi:hypothetical protein
MIARRSSRDGGGALQLQRRASLRSPTPRSAREIEREAPSIHEYICGGREMPMSCWLKLDGQMARDGGSPDLPSGRSREGFPRQATRAAASGAEESFTLSGRGKPGPDARHIPFYHGADAMTLSVGPEEQDNGEEAGDASNG